MQNELPIHVHSDSDGENSLPGRTNRREYIPSKQHSALEDREWCARELQSQYEQPNNWIIAGLHRMKCTLASTATSICKLHLAIRDRPTRSIYPFLYLFCGQCFMYGAIIASLLAKVVHSCLPWTHEERNFVNDCCWPKTIRSAQPTYLPCD